MKQQEEARIQILPLVASLQLPRFVREELDGSLRILESGHRGNRLVGLGGLDLEYWLWRQARTWLFSDHLKRSCLIGGVLRPDSQLPPDINKRMYVVDILPASKSMTPDPDQKMRIILDSPIHRPIRGRFQIINRDFVTLQIPNPLEMFNERLQFIIPSNDRLGIDSGNCQVGEQDCFLS
jgi:hypothetical protein